MRGLAGKTVAGIVRPGVPQGRRSDALCYLYDVFPTLCALGGLNVPNTVEGEDLTLLMHDTGATVRDEIFGAYGNVQRMVRTDRWKVIYYPHNNRTQFFDLKNIIITVSTDCWRITEEQQRIANAGQDKDRP